MPYVLAGKKNQIGICHLNVCWLAIEALKRKPLCLPIRRSLIKEMKYIMLAHAPCPYSVTIKLIQKPIHNRNLRTVNTQGPPVPNTLGVEYLKAVPPKSPSQIPSPPQYHKISPHPPSQSSTPSSPPQSSHPHPRYPANRNPTPP
jgi:hypothetical protein